MSIVSATDSFVMLRAYHDKGTTRLPNTSTIRKYELLFLNFLEANFQVDEAAVEITMSIPTNLGTFFTSSCFSWDKPHQVTQATI